jgi:hypothetical protein
MKKGVESGVGFGSGSISQRNGSGVRTKMFTDPQHWIRSTNHKYER